MSPPSRPPDYTLEYTVHGETVHAPVWTITEGKVPREVLARVARGLLRRGQEREADTIRSNGRVRESA